MINYFVCIHNTKLLNMYNHKSIIQPQYLLLGNNDTHEENESTIVCNQLTDNIENFPYLCSYTGWYAVSKNKLCDQNIVSLLEYDTLLSNNFYISNKEIINKQKNNQYIIAYSKTSTNHYVFYKSTPWLEIALKQTHDIDLISFVNKYHQTYPFWPTTTNITMPRIVLAQFIDWFQPMCKVFRHHPMGAYVHERAFFIYCVLHNINIIYDTNILEHKQLSSHGIKDIYGSFLEKHQTRDLTPDLLKKYDYEYETASYLCKQKLEYNNL